MVRTYAYNPATQGNIFNDAIAQSSTSTSNLPSRHSTEVQQPGKDVEVLTVHHQVPPSQQCICNVSSSQYHTPFHSPHIDPVGSIIGLRVHYIDGKLCYIPVEPQINYLINQQFGNGFCIFCARKNGYLSSMSSTPASDSLFYNDSREVRPMNANSQSAPQNKYAVDTPTYQSTVAASPMRNNMRTDGTIPEAQPSHSGHRAPSLVPYSGASASLPNLAKKNALDPTEQYKLELQRQIEENKRRRELELEKERLEEEREMQRIERYNEQIRKEKEEEERRLRERARAAERRNEQIQESQQRQERRVSSVPRREPARSPSPSETPQLEWWEKKPSWQEVPHQERSIPAVPASSHRTPTHSAHRRNSRHSASNYDPAASVELHEREGSRASNRSDHHRVRTPMSSASSRRTPTRSSKGMNRQDSRASVRHDSDRENEINGVDILAANVARDPRGRPTSFVIK